MLFLESFISISVFVPRKGMVILTAESLYKCSALKLGRAWQDRSVSIPAAVENAPRHRHGSRLFPGLGELRGEQVVVPNSSNAILFGGLVFFTSSSSNSSHSCSSGPFLNTLPTCTTKGAASPMAPPITKKVSSSWAPADWIRGRGRLGPEQK